MQLKDKRVLLTGGSLGIGKATAKALTAAGARVAITARHKSPLKAAAEATGAFPIQMDMARQDDIDHTFDTFMAEFGGIDVLINNAGIGSRAPLSEVERDEFERIYAVNVIGVAMMTKRAAAVFIEQEKGHIINIGSTAGIKGYPTGTIYASSKFALRGMTYCWQQELRKHNIRVFLVNPSEVTTAIGNPERKERPYEPNKLRPAEIAHAIKAILEMDDRGFIPELSVWATNPWM